MAAKRIAIYFNTFKQSYCVRIEYENDNLIILQNRVGLSEYDKKRLLEYFKDHYSYKDLLGSIDIKDSHDDEIGWDILTRCIDSFNSNLPLRIEWRIYNASNDSLNSDKEIDAELNKNYANDVLMFISELQKEEFSLDMIKRLIKEDIAKKANKKKGFALYKCDKCGEYSIIKDKDKIVCQVCKKELYEPVFTGSHDECVAEKNRLTDNKKSSKSEDEVYILFDKKYHSSNPEDVVRLHQALFDNYLPDYVFIEDGLISYNPKFVSFINKTVYKNIIANFDSTLFTDEVESTFLKYLLYFKKECGSHLDVYPVISYRGDKLKTPKQYFSLLLSDKSLVKYFFEDFYYESFFKVNPDFRNKNRTLSALIYLETKKFAYYDSHYEKIVVLSDNLFNVLTELKDENELKEYRKFITDYLLYFHDYPGLEEQFKFTDLDAMQAISFSDYDAISYFDYLLNGKIVYRYKGIKIILDYKEPKEYHRHLFETLKDIYLYESRAIDTIYSNFLEAVSSPVFKLIFNETNKELFEKIEKVRTSGDNSILTMYLELCPELDPQKVEFNLANYKGTLIAISRLVTAYFKVDETRQFVSSFEIEKIMKKMVNNYDEFKESSRRDFNKLLDF